VFAMSLDGYIAGPNGEADWIIMHRDIDFQALFEQFDAFRAQPFDGLLEEVDVRQLLWAMRKRWCAPEDPLRARSNCGSFARSLPLASWAIAEDSVEPSMRALSIRRADLPMTFVATEASFMLAPSNVFCSLPISAERSRTRVVR
jgi:hypothetical protein